MIRGGADKICFVISPGKSDILGYYGAGYGAPTIAYVVQPPPPGLCDAIFRAAPLVGRRAGAGRPARHHLVSARTALARCRTTAVVPALPGRAARALRRRGDGRGRPGRARSRSSSPGALALDLGRVQDAGPRAARVARACGASESGATNISARWSTPISRAAAGRSAVKAGESYVDVGTLDGYRSAMQMLDRPEPREGQARKGVAHRR